MTTSDWGERMLCRITEYMRLEHIAPELQAADKPSLLKEFATLICTSQTDLDATEVCAKLTEREAKASTGADHGVAIPHAKLPQTQKLIVAFGRSKQGIPFDALDNKDSNLFFVVLAPITPTPNQVNYLQIISAICRLMRSSSLRSKLLNAAGAEDLLNTLKHEESTRPSSPAVTLFP